MVNGSVHSRSTRPAAPGVSGMVAAAHPLASVAGLGVLMDGGNAFDAAVATAATLNVVEPYMSGMGGLGVALVFVARENRTRVLNFSGRAPRAAEPSRLTEETKRKGIFSPLVPGNVAGWLTLHETYGRLDRERLFQPSIDYAENGYPVSQLNSRIINNQAPQVANFTPGPSPLQSAGQVLRQGSRLKIPQLARSLREVAKHGKETFYRGELGERIVKANREMGGLFAQADFSDYEAEWQDPIEIDYRGFKIYTTPPNSSGFQVLENLKLMQGFGDKDLVFQHPDTLHLMMEAAKLCVTDRIKYAGDPDYVQIPLPGLLSDAYAARQRMRIDRGKAAVVSGEHFTNEVPAGSIAAGSQKQFDGGLTTFFTVADRDGNVVSVTQTLGGGFGSGVAIGDTGIFLNNMCYWFDLEQGSANLIGPSKRVDFVGSPTHTMRDGKFALSIGTPGSWGILQTTPQMLMNALDFGMGVQEAIEAPRFRCVEGRRVEMEERFPADVRRALEDRGHEVSVIEPWSMSVGGAQGIRVDAEEGVFQGGADPRRDGYAIGW